MTKEEVLQHDKKFRYMLLSRMQSDCEYYLNYGNRNPKRLWAGDEQRQIEYMIPVSYTHLRAHETGRNLVCRLLLEKKKKETANCKKTIKNKGRKGQGGMSR